MRQATDADTKQGVANTSAAGDQGRQVSNRRRGPFHGQDLGRAGGEEILCQLGRERGAVCEVRPIVAKCIDEGVGLQWVDWKSWRVWLEWHE